MTTSTVSNRQRNLAAVALLVLLAGLGVGARRSGKDDK
jgi:hypothetical protein